MNLVTGATGLLGSHIVERLVQAGQPVRVLVRATSDTTFLDTLGVEKVIADLADPASLAKACRGVGVVYHSAARVGDWGPWHEFQRDTIDATANLAQAALKAGVRRFIHTSTSETYGTARYTPMDEQHPLQAQSPYAASKIAADKIVESFACSFNLPAVTVRPFNTYGPRQSARAVIPAIITQALDSRVVRLGALDPVRDLTYVSDTAAGFIAAAAAPVEANGQVVNLGTGAAVSIGELAELVFDILGGEFEIVAEEARVRPEQSEVMRLISNNAQARTLLGWSPQVMLREGLERTIAWIDAHRGEFKPGRYAV